MGFPGGSDGKESTCNDGDLGRKAPEVRGERCPQGEALGVLCYVGSVVSDSATLWTEPTRLLFPWDFPGKNIGVGCHFLLQEA